MTKQKAYEVLFKKASASLPTTAPDDCYHKNHFPSWKRIYIRHYFGRSLVEYVLTWARGLVPVAAETERWPFLAFLAHNYRCGLLFPLARLPQVHPDPSLVDWLYVARHVVRKWLLNTSIAAMLSIASKETLAYNILTHAAKGEVFDDKWYRARHPDLQIGVDDINGLFAWLNSSISDSNWLSCQNLPQGCGRLNDIRNGDGV